MPLNTKQRLLVLLGPGLLAQAIQEIWRATKARRNGIGKGGFLGPAA